MDPLTIWGIARRRRSIDVTQTDHFGRPFKVHRNVFELKGDSKGLVDLHWISVHRDRDLLCHQKAGKEKQQADQPVDPGRGCPIEGGRLGHHQSFSILSRLLFRLLAFSWACNLARKADSLRSSISKIRAASSG